MEKLFGIKKILLLIILATGISYSQLIYVKHDASGNNSGTSWANAFNNLSDAINSAVSGDTIFVAAGIYYPDRGAGITIGDRYASFVIKSGVVLMGGYAGNENFESLSVRWKKYGRDWQINKTILSGDLNQDDSGNLSADEPTRMENSIRIVTIQDVEDSTTEINGFFIESGNANSPAFDNNSNGGGMIIHNSDIRIKNCLFRNNTAIANGGAVYTNSGEPLFDNSIFINNSAASGGAVYFRGSGDLMMPDKPVVLNSFFNNNKASAYGGAISINKAADVIFRNAVIAGNNTPDVGSAGGGAWADNESYPDFINCTIYNNAAVSSGGGLSLTAGRIINSIIRGNSSENNSQIDLSGMPANSLVTRDFSNSSVEGGFSGTQIYDLDPGFISSGNITGDDGLFGTQDDGLIPGDLSSVVDSGTGLSMHEFSDARGLPRISGLSVDFGAYEKQRFDLGLEVLLAELKTGGYTVLFNHMKTIPTEIDSPGYQVDLHWCWMQKNVSEEGMEQGRFIGGALKFLGINFDVILCSPMCRTKESTRQMFGRDSTEHDIFKSSFIWLQDDTTYLFDRRARLGTLLGAGHNTVIVTHSSTIAEMTGLTEDEIKEGDAIVVKPLGGTNYESVAHITTETWSKLFKYNIETTGVDDYANIPSRFILYDNYPNPFNPATNFKYSINYTGRVTLKIFDILGREIKTLVNEVKTPGEYNIAFNANGLGSGVYFAQLSSDKEQTTKKIVLLK